AVAFAVIAIQKPGPGSIGSAAAIVVGALVFLRRGLFERLSLWVDRRFFREAYSVEQVLADLSEEARGFLDAKPLHETVTRRIVETLHIPRAAVLLKDQHRFCVARRIGDAADDASCLPGDGKTIQYLREARRPAVVYFDDPKSWIRLAREEEREKLKALDAQLLLPLAGREELLGVMVLGPKRSEEPYSRTDLQLLQSVAVQAGLALENSQLMASVAAEAALRERLNREIEIAREVQERLFPQVCPPVAGIDYAGRCRPAQAVGGDYYDFVPLPGGKLGIALGDVSGKGISAALLMASLQASLRGQAIARVDDLPALMRNVNSLVYEASATNRYATFFYGEYDAGTRELRYVNAGHNAPLVLRGSDVARLEVGGSVIGLFPGATYEAGCCQLQPGCILVVFTDGISEAITPQEEEWGEERLILTVQSCRDLTAAEIVGRVMAAADAFTAGAAQYDDMTIVVVKVG